MPLFEKLPVSRDDVAAAVAECWGLELGAALKESQNTTYAATRGAERFAVRASPDPRNERHARILDELAFVSYVARTVPGVCAPEPPTGAEDGALAVRRGDVTLCVSRWAEGAPVDFASFRWLTDADVVAAWGAWLARLHAASREFQAAHADVARRMPAWDEVHERTLAGSPLHPDDVAAMTDPARFGLLHGDANLSNFHVVEAPEEGGGAPSLCVFDWDQAQRGWWEADLAQAALTCTMLHEGGALPAGAEPVPQADAAAVAAFHENLIAGYESVAGAGAVDRARFARMRALRKRLYALFCARATQEGSTDDMGWFISYVQQWMAKAPPEL